MGETVKLAVRAMPKCKREGMIGFLSFHKARLFLKLGTLDFVVVVRRAAQLKVTFYRSHRSFQH